jgi:gliding motility-associated-like protein
VTVTTACDTLTASTTLSTGNPPAQPWQQHQEYICGKDTTLTLDAQNAGSTFLWNTGESTQTITTNETQIFWVAITNECGTITDTIDVVIDPDEGIFVPNVFTPNGDGINDIFLPEVRNKESYTLTILDRWGVQMFTTTETQTGWNGTRNGSEAPEGSYLCIVLAMSCNGEVKRFSHFVTLVR